MQLRRASSILEAGEQAVEENITSPEKVKREEQRTPAGGKEEDDKDDDEEEVYSEDEEEEVVDEVDVNANVEGNKGDSD